MQKKISSLPFLLILMMSSSYLFYFIISTNIAFANATPIPAFKTILSFCSGASHSCAVFGNFKMKCWGYSLGYGGNENSPSYGDTPSTIGDAIPYFNPGSSLSIKQVTCRSPGICMLLNTGNIKCVGPNTFGQAGIGSNVSPIGSASGHIGDTLPIVNVGSGLTVLSMAGGNSHTCVLTSEKKVKCFGDNFYGQLGLGDAMHRGSSLSHLGDNLQFTDLGANVEVESVHSSSSAFHNCVILSAPGSATQRLKCWGNNVKAQLGYGDMSNKGDAQGEMGDNLPLIDLGDESRVKNIALGMLHTCAYLVNDLLKCFGEGTYGQLGSGTAPIIAATGNFVPYVVVDGKQGVQLISAGGTHTCIVYDDQLTMKCIGNNIYGQLGQGDQSQRGHTPGTMIPLIPAIQLGTGSLKISSIHSGLYYTCVVYIDSSVKCFGENSYGQFATGSTSLVGNDKIEMGNNLQFSKLFSSPGSTPSPSSNKTKKPTRPTKSPTRR